MKYALNKKEKKFELVSFPEEIKGLEITPKNKKGESPLEVKNITIVDDKLIKSYVMQMINKKFDKIVKLINKILVEDDDGDAQIVLDEIQKFKSMLINKYKEHLTEKKYKELLSKIILMEEEFKVRFNQKMLFRQIIDFEEEKGIRR